MNIIKIILFISSALLPFGCYTVVMQSLKEYPVHGNQPTLLPNTEDTSELAGVWIHKRLWMDYGYEYNRLEIYENGKLVYIPSSERSNSEIFYGNYNISSDTVSVVFDGLGLELMSYNLNADTLLLKSIYTYGGAREGVINDCYSCMIRWIRTH